MLDFARDKHGFKLCREIRCSMGHMQIPQCQHQHHPHQSKSESPDREPNETKITHQHIVWLTLQKKKKSNKIYVIVRENTSPSLIPSKNNSLSDFTYLTLQSNSGLLNLISRGNKGLIPKK
jgi:hypothetical protein